MRYRCVSQDGRVYHVRDSETRLDLERAEAAIVRHLRIMGAAPGIYSVRTQTRSGYVSDVVAVIELEGSA